MQGSKGKTKMLMELGIVLPLMFTFPVFVRQPPDGYATAVASSSPPLLRGNFSQLQGAVAKRRGLSVEDSLFQGSKPLKVSPSVPFFQKGI